jgi:hypothetical protein
MTSIGQVLHARTKIPRCCVTCVGEKVVMTIAETCVICRVTVLRV